MCLALFSHAQSREASDVQQEKTYRNNQFLRIYFGYGASIVLGDYAETDFDNIESGFAENGRRITFGLHYNVGDNNFLTAEYISFSHSIDSESLFSGSGLSSQQYNVDDYSVGAVIPM